MTSLQQFVKLKTFATTIVSIKAAVNVKNNFNTASPCRVKSKLYLLLYI